MSDLPGRSAGRGEWSTLLDEVVRGIGHTLNNRLAGFRALVELARLDGDAGAGATALAAETEALERAVRLLNLLPRRPYDAPAPLLAQDVLARAADLYVQHDRLRDIPLALDPAPSVPPTHADEGALLRAILLLLGAAGRAAPVLGGEVFASLAASGDVVSVTIGTRPGASPAPWPAARGPEPWHPLDRADAASLAREAGGELAVVEEDDPATGVRYLLHLPTLASVRRAEAAARAARGGGPE